MNWKDIRNQKWYPYTVAICSGVILYMCLNNLSFFLGIFSFISKYFGTVILAFAIAYMINPLAKLIQKVLFHKEGQDGWGASSLIAMILVLLLFVLLGVSVVPQLVASIRTFVDNIDTYVATAEKMISDLGLSQTEFMQNLIESSNHLIDTLGDLISKNLSDILAASANVGKSVANFAIAMVLSLYVLAEKASLKIGIRRFLRAVLSANMYRALGNFYQKCDDILVRYISCSLLESVIIGCSNALFMTIFHMEFAGLISVIVAVTNLIPTFGPIIGGVIAAFILVLVDPAHALMFIIFTIILQAIDGYVIKPKLFGNSLGVSGLMILIAVIVFGKLFGMLGILFAIPAAAIIEFTYNQLLIPYLENRKKNREASSPAQ